MSTRGSALWRREQWGVSCDRTQLAAEYWLVGAGKIQCHRHATQAFRALGRVLRLHRYQVRSEVTGCYNCRKITGGTTASAHAYGIALDVNWDTNPYDLRKLITDMDRGMIADVLQIKTDAGVRAFRWGGDWDGRPETPEGNYDAMHFEIIATPDELRAGFSIPAPIPSQRDTWPLLALDEHGPAVEMLQSLIGMVKEDQDGIFGPRTSKAVRVFQSSRGLPADGYVGLGTWTALFHELPPIAESGVSPHKEQARAGRDLDRVIDLGRIDRNALDEPPAL